MATEIVHSVFDGYYRSEELNRRWWSTRTRADKDTAGSDQAYTYDANGRLTQVADTASGCTTTRAYVFDKNSNRTSLTTTLGTGCVGTAPAPVTSTYDSADRLTSTGYVYDALGRSTTAPLPNGTATLEYHANDLVRRQTIGTARQTWTLDPGMRLRGWTTETESGGTWTQNGSKTNHYDDDGDPEKPGPAFQATPRPPAPKRTRGNARPETRKRGHSISQTVGACPPSAAPQLGRM